jgi:sigma-B regulation protein RsbU (phosphoserine phosphatase)
MTTNELTTNAVYNAPVDENDVPKYEKTDRKVKVQLLDTEAVTVAVCHDAERLGIAVSDQFGRLTRDKIVRHLVKCVNNTAFIENKQGGAGAGIYLAFYTANQFVINIEPGKRLEAICILEQNKRYKEYRNRVTSFNYFKKIGGAA